MIRLITDNIIIEVNGTIYIAIYDFGDDAECNTPGWTLCDETGTELLSINGCLPYFETMAELKKALEKHLRECTWRLNE
ncbi:MAG TPA: hypothetical protein ENH85_06210 [Candidatus Scalindua sp.]|nr:hypothetical protein [Candidatus Scalindua sp.]